jgi:hypothetical protein
MESVLDRLNGHSLLADDRLRNRLKMCADCRVIDMMSHEPGNGS